MPASLTDWALRHPTRVCPPDTNATHIEPGFLHSSQHQRARTAARPFIRLNRRFRMRCLWVVPFAKLQMSGQPAATSPMTFTLPPPAPNPLTATAPVTLDRNDEARRAYRESR